MTDSSKAQKAREFIVRDSLDSDSYRDDYCAAFDHMTSDEVEREIKLTSNPETANGYCRVIEYSAYQQIEKELQETKEENRKLKECLYKIRPIAVSLRSKSTLAALLIVDAIDEATKQWTVTEVNHGKSKE